MFTLFYSIVQLLFIIIIIRQIIIVIITMWTFYMDDAPFRSTEKRVINDLTNNIDLSKNGIIYDLGSGTGEALFLLAKNSPANFIGIEKNKLLHLYAVLRNKFKKNTKIKFVNEDINNLNLSNANLIYSYLSGTAYQKFGDKFANELKKETIFIALRFKFDHPQFKLEKVVKSKYPIYIYKKISNIRPSTK